MNTHWDKELAKLLREKGIKHEVAMEVVGIVAEMKQSAYLSGYKNGYNNGAAEEKVRIEKKQYYL